MDISLNIDEYELIDLLNLFKLDFDFNEQDLKKVKKTVLQTHPDKSPHLSKEYFLFFSEAYKIIYSVYQFRYKSTNGNSNANCNSNANGLVYNVEKDDQKEALLSKLKEQSNFNELFNGLFEKYKLNDSGVDAGYGDWLKSDEDIDTRSTTLTGMNESFQTKKKEVQSLVKIDKIEETGSNNSVDMYDLTGDKPEYYSSGLFSNLAYEDLKKAHVESVIPVTHEDYLRRTKYCSVDELQRSSDYQDATPLSLAQSKVFLKQQQYSDNKNDVHRAFKLAKQDEDVRKKNEGWMSHFKTLTHF
jgi:hypothetical protein